MVSRSNSMFCILVGAIKHNRGLSMRLGTKWQRIGVRVGTSEIQSMISCNMLKERKSCIFTYKTMSQNRISHSFAHPLLTHS